MRLLYLVFVLLLSCGAVVGIYRLLLVASYQKMVVKEDRGGTITRTTYNNLITTNTSFIAADWALRKGQYTEAQTQYLQAFSEAEEPQQQAYIKWAFAQTLERQERPVEAIRVLKEIAADESYPKNMRALAVQSMGELAYRFGDVSVYRTIFNSEPYASMAAGVGSRFSFRRLYEYAVSFYPLALSELHIADYYAAALLSPDLNAALRRGALDVSTYRDRAQDALARADIDTRRMQSAASPDYELLAEVFTLKGQVLDKLIRAGVMPVQDAQDAEDAFKTALEFYSRADTYGRQGADGMTRFWYAAHLSRTFFGRERHADIRVVLAPFHTDPSYVDSGAARFFQSGRAKNNYGKIVISLSTIDKQFGAFLLSLGLVRSEFENREE